MNYTIKTPSAKKLKQEILDRVSEKADVNGKGIATWKCVETYSGDIVLAHTEDQWGEKGCLQLIPSIAGTEVLVQFHYWDSCNPNNKSNDDDKYILGRFTELLLVHFFYMVDKIILE